MELKINNQIKKFDCNTLTVQQLLDFELPEKQNGIAIAINEKIVSRNHWNTYVLSPKDTILIITATQGG